MCVLSAVKQGIGGTSGGGRNGGSGGSGGSGRAGGRGDHGGSGRDGGSGGGGRAGVRGTRREHVCDAGLVGSGWRGSNRYGSGGIGREVGHKTKDGVLSSKPVQWEVVSGVRRVGYCKICLTFHGEKYDCKTSQC